MRVFQACFLDLLRKHYSFVFVLLPQQNALDNYKGQGSEVKLNIMFCMYKQLLNQAVYTKILTILFLQCFDMRKKNLTDKIFSQVSVHVDILPLPLLGTVEISTIGISTSLNPIVAGLFFVRPMKSILAPSLPLRVYGLMRSTHNAL